VGQFGDLFAVNTESNVKVSVVNRGSTEYFVGLLVSESSVGGAFVLVETGNGLPLLGGFCDVREQVQLHG